MLTQKSSAFSAFIEYGMDAWQIYHKDNGARTATYEAHLIGANHAVIVVWSGSLDGIATQTSNFVWKSRIRAELCKLELSMEVST